MPGKALELEALDQINSNLFTKNTDESISYLKSQETGFHTNNEVLSLMEINVQIKSYP